MQNFAFSCFKLLSLSRHNICMCKQTLVVESLTVFVGVHRRALPPAEAEVAQTHAEDQREAEVHLVRHEDQHQDVREGGLDDVEQRLYEVAH